MTDLEDVTLRTAGIADLDAVTDLVAASYAQYEAVFPPAMWAVYRADMLALSGVVADGAVIVAEARGAEAGGRIVGSVVFHADGSIDRPPWPAGIAAFRLLAVSPDVRGAGIGELLVRECERRARAAGAWALGLHTAPFMDAAVRLYERRGFRRAPDLDFDAYERFGVAKEQDGPPLCGSAHLLDLAAGPV